MILPTALGVVTVDLYGGQTHQWATGVRLFGREGELRLEWFEDEHPHSCAVVGAPRVIGDELHLEADPHGPMVVRAIGPGDTWRVFPSGLTAWKAVRRGLR